MTPKIKSKLPKVGVSIFTEMSALAAKENAVNLSQGFPDFPIDPKLTQYLEEASAKGLQSNIDKLKELKKTSSENKSTLNTMAEQINVLGGTEGIVNGDWVANHLKDIQAMANGEVSEWPMVQSWKDCVGAIPPGVRIPSSPNLSGLAF